VVKADGLAAGKGVVGRDERPGGAPGGHHMLVDKSMGDAGPPRVIEDSCRAEEASFIVMCDGREVLRSPAARTTSG